MKELSLLAVHFLCLNCTFKDLFTEFQFVVTMIGRQICSDRKMIRSMVALYFAPRFYLKLKWSLIIRRTRYKLSGMVRHWSILFRSSFCLSCKLGLININITVLPTIKISWKLSFFNLFYFNLFTCVKK